MYKLDWARSSTNFQVQLVLKLGPLEILLGVRKAWAHIIVFKNMILSEFQVKKRFGMKKTSMRVFLSGRCAILFFK